MFLLPAVKLHIRRLHRFLKMLKVRPSYFVWPVALSLAAAFFEAISLGLLVPTLQGIVARDFSFIYEHRYLGNFVRYLPSRLTDRDITLFAMLGAAIVLAAGLKIILRYVASMRVAFITRVVSHELRQRLFERYLTFGKLFYDATNFGYLSQVLLVYTRRITIPIAEAHQLLNTGFSLLVYIGLMFTISWELTLFILCIFPLSTYFTGLLVKRLKNKSSRHVEALNHLSRKAHTILSVFPLVTAYAQESQEQRRFSDLSNKVAAQEFNIARSQQLIRPLQDSMVLLTIILLAVGMTILLRTQPQGGSASYLVFFYLVMNAANTYGSLHRFQGAVAEEEGPLQEIRQMFSDENKFIIPSGTRSFAGLRQAITFQGLHFTFPGREKVIEALTLTIPAGRVTALVGPTGAGKTTLINLLMRYYNPPPGTLLLDGIDIREFDSASLRRRIALVSQDVLLLNDSLRVNILYGLDRVSESKLASTLEQACLAELVRRLPQGLDTLIGDRGVMLSGGEKQRVAIARALLKRAEIIILDEATSALDSKTEKLIQQAITTAIKGKTAIVIAHRLSTIKHADMIAVLEKGKVVEQGSLSELLAAQSHFYEYWEAQKFF